MGGGAQHHGGGAQHHGGGHSTMGVGHSTMGGGAQHHGGGHSTMGGGAQHHGGGAQHHGAWGTAPCRGWGTAVVVSACLFVFVQKRMAKMLEEEFGHHLVSEDLELWQRRAHLPSPADLKHKILLKDSFRYQRRDQDGESPPLPETLPSPTGLSPRLCPAQPTSEHLPGADLSLPPDMSLSTSLSPHLFQGVPESHLRHRSEPQFRGVSESQLRGVSESQLRGVSESQLRGVPESQLRGVSESQLRGVSKSQLRGVSESQLRGVSKSQPQGVFESQPQGVPKSQPGGVRTGVTFDIPETTDYFRTQKHRRVSSK